MGFLSVAAVSCAGAPEFVIKNSNSGSLLTNPDGTALMCERDGPLEENFDITPSSIRGANVVFAIDDSQSMTDNIVNLSNSLNAFLTDLAVNAQNNFRVVLLFRLGGFEFGDGNGTAFPVENNVPPVNPFATHIANNPNVFYYPVGTGSRALDVGIFRAFSTPTFMQDLLATWPNDFLGGLQTQANCSGAGKYFRPRSGSSSQVNTSCFSSPAPGFNALSRLLPGTSVNIVGMTDDDLNVSGGFPGDGLKIVKDMFTRVLAPAAGSAPIYYHSFAGTSTTPPPNAVGDIDRVGVNNIALSNATGGLVADIRSPNYASVLNQLRTRIVFSEQLVDTACQSDGNYPIEVLKDGVLLDPSLYTFNLGTREVRLLPAAFTDADLDRASIDITVRY